MEKLKDYINETVLRRGRVVKSTTSINSEKDTIQKLYDEEGDLTIIRDCVQWLDELNWETKSKNEYAKYISSVNSVVSELYAKRVYCDCMIAMASIGRSKTIDILKDIAGESEMKDFNISI